MTHVIDHLLLDTWETTAMQAIVTFCTQHPLEVLLSAFGLFLAHDPADPLWRNRKANVVTIATLDPFGAIQMTGLCLMPSTASRSSRARPPLILSTRLRLYT